MSTMDRLYKLVSQPIITEKGSGDTAKRNAFHFRVPIDANKIEIRTAVEKVFNVKVKKVNTLRAATKVRRRGYSVGTTPAWKRAMVVLEEGNVIDVL
ncbi:MAG: 50S ribosomal protein L23 [Planctomycetes bacterium]|nr:50S ribosomal protein L23 [Planctomycetota bacterium]